MVSQYTWCPRIHGFLEYMGVLVYMVSKYTWCPNIHGVLVHMVSQYTWCPSKHGVLECKGVLVYMVSQYTWCPSIHGFLVYMVSQYSWCPSLHSVLVYMMHVSYSIPGVLAMQGNLYKYTQVSYIYMHGILQIYMVSQWNKCTKYIEYTVYNIQNYII